MNYIGIDVGAKEVVVVVSVKGKARKAKVYTNTTSGHQAIIQLLSTLKTKYTFVLKQRVSTIAVSHGERNARADSPQ
jgi:transposase